MNIANLFYYCAVCETLNYTEAAKKCFVSRQAIRQSVQTLEEHYQIKLIENKKNHLFLTPAGNLLYMKAKNVLDSYQELEISMDACITVSEPIRLGISHTLVPYYAPEIMELIWKFQECYPNISLKLSYDSSENILEYLEKGVVDAGIVIDMNCLSQKWNRLDLRIDTMNLMMSESHPLAEKERITLQDLDQNILIVMGEISTFFAPLEEDLKTLNSSVKYKVVPEYHEAVYRVLQKKNLAMNREEDVENSYSDVYIIRSLEDGKYKLYCTLLTSKAEHKGVSLLQSYLCSKLNASRKLEKTNNIKCR